MDNSNLKKHIKKGELTITSHADTSKREYHNSVPVYSTYILDEEEAV